MSALPFGLVFSLFLKRKLSCSLFDVDMRIPIDKALKHVYVIGKSNIVLPWIYIIVLDI